MRLAKRLSDLEARAGDIDMAILTDAMLTLELCDAVHELAERLDATGSPVPDGLLTAMETADWSTTIRKLEALECEA